MRVSDIIINEQLIMNKPIKVVDALTYAQYASVLESGLLSLDALARIIRHDSISSWSESNESATRVAVLQDCQTGKLPYKKSHDEVGDLLFGKRWPLPPNFALKGI